MADRGKQPVVSGQKADSGPPDDPTITNQVATAGIEALQPQQHFQNTANNSMAMAAAQMPALALEHNIDLSVPANVNLIAQTIPMMQSRMISNTSVQSSSAQQPPVRQASSSQEANESSPHGNTSSDASGQSYSSKARHSVSAPNVSSMNNSSNIPSQRSSPQPMSSPNNGVQGTLPPSQGSSATESQQSSLGFDEQQLHVLKAQILAFRRIRKGDSSLPLDILQAIGLPPPVTETQPKHFETSEKGKKILSEDEERRACKTASFSVHVSLNALGR